jgi:hypothetical protein
MPGWAHLEQVDFELRPRRHLSTSLGPRPGPILEKVAEHVEQEEDAHSVQIREKSL